MKSKVFVGLLLAVFAAVVGLPCAQAQTATPTLTGSSYAAPVGSNPGVISLKGNNLAAGATASLALLSPDTNAGQTLYAIDSSSVTVQSSSTAVVKLTPGFFTNYKYFRENGITDLRPGTYYVQLSNPNGQSSGFQAFQVPLQIIEPPQPLGWQMVSSPYTIGATFNNLGVYAAAWQPQLNGGQGQYVVSYSNPPGVPADTYHLGQGYWVFLTQTAAIQGPVTGTAPAGPFSIPLQAGWNQVGDPFVSSVPLSNLSIQSNAGTSSFTAALASSSVSPLYAYNAQQMAYVTLSTDTQTMDPWQGEWLYTAQAATLVVTPPAVNEFTLSGQVVNSQTGLPIPAQVQGLPAGTRVYPNGHIQTPAIPNGLYTLTISSGGFSGQITTARVSDGNVNLYKIRLDPNPNAASRARGGSWVPQGSGFAIGSGPSRQQNGTAPVITATYTPSFFVTQPAYVTITGANFDVSYGVLELAPGQTTATPEFNSPGEVTHSGQVIFSSSPPTFIVWLFSSAPTGVWKFGVVNPQTGVASNAVNVTIPGSSGGTSTTTGGGSGAAPAITAATYTPPAGQNPAVVQISGSNFIATPTVSVALQSPNTAPGQQLYPIDPTAVTFNSSSSLTVSIPQSFFNNPTLQALGITSFPPGTYYLQVTNPDGTVSNFQPVVVPAAGSTTGGTTGTSATTTGGGAAPVVTTASYTAGNPDSNTPSIINLTGANLAQVNSGVLSTQTGSTTSLGSGNFTPPDNTGQQVNVYLGSPLDPGLYSLQVQSPAGSTSITFTVAQPSSPSETPPPGFNVSSRFLLDVSDNGPPAPILYYATYDGATAITLGGINFVAGTHVTLDGPPAGLASLTMKVALNSANQMTATLSGPLSATGAYTVQVRGPGDPSSSTPSNTATFNVGGASPSLYTATYDPQGYPGVSSSPVLSLWGDNFYEDQNAPTVILNGKEYNGSNGVRFDPTNTSQILVELPAAQSPGTYTVQVRNPDGELSEVISLKVTSAVSITNATYFRTTQGSTLVISGSGFQNQANVQVDLDDNLYYVGSLSDSLIVGSNANALSTDPGANPHFVEIRNPDGGGADLIFTVKPDQPPNGNSGTGSLSLLQNGLSLANQAQSFKTFNTSIESVIILFSSPIVSTGGSNIVASGAGNVISNDGGSLIGNAGGALIGNAGGALISQDGSGLIPLSDTVFSSIVASGAGNLVASGAGNIITQNLAALISAQNTLISQDGGALINPSAGFAAVLGPSNSLFNGGESLIGDNQSGFVGHNGSSFTSDNGAG